jgi:hypothetical protein
MKSFRLLTQQISQWWRVVSATSQKQLNYTFQRVIDEAKRHTTQPLKRQSSHASVSPLALAVAVISLTSAIGYRFYNEPKLAVGTLAPQTLRAPDSAVVIDTETTEENRKAARTGSVPVLMIDSTVNQEIYQSLQRLLDEAGELREQAGAFPYIDTSILSASTQQYLRDTEEKWWRAAITAAETTRSSVAPSVPVTPIQKAPADAESGPNTAQQLAIIELHNYRRTHSAEDFLALKQVLARARQRYVETMASLAERSLTGANRVYDSSLFVLTDAEWHRTKIGIRQALERILTQGIPLGLPNSILENAARSQVNIDVPNSAVPLATKILMAVTQPNLIQDSVRTRLRAEQAARDVEPVTVVIQRGEVIVWAGEQISQSNFVLLDHFKMSRRGINWFGLVGFATWISGAVLFFLLIEWRFYPGLRRRDYLLLILLTLTTPPLVALGFSSTSLPLVGLLAGSFYGSVLGVTVVGLLSATLAIGMDIGWSYLIASAVASLVGASMAGRRRSREELALLGITIGLIQGGSYLLLSLSLSSAASLVWYAVLTAAALQGLIGIAWSVVALGISPYLEHLFDLVTPVRLAELSNPNRPLLKRLASEAPGTFQHTLFVASLAEAAARALGCNVELVRAGTLYHDIGKMHDAMGFIENQMGRPNKHDVINNPWKSAEIIKKHVSEGLVMARRYRLPKAIKAFIPEHQGTMLIAYFYHEAQQRARENPRLMVNEADFRYDGPSPQSRETGIVMLADSCEAALRSLKDATYEEALAMVNRILRARWQDNQLRDSHLTRAEMARIAAIFVQVWQQYNHQRIAYPKLNSTSQPSPVGG